MEHRQFSGSFSMNQRSMHHPGRGESRSWHGDVWSWNRTSRMSSNGEVQNSTADAEPCLYRYPPPGRSADHWISDNPMETGREHCKRKNPPGYPSGSGDEGSSSSSRWHASGYSSNTWDYYYHHGWGSTHSPVFTSRNVRSHVPQEAGAAATGGTVDRREADYLFHARGAHHPRTGSSGIQFTSALDDHHIPFQQDTTRRYYHQHDATRLPPFAYWRSFKAARQPATWSTVPAGSSSSSSVHLGGYPHHHGSTANSTTVPSQSPDHFPFRYSRLVPVSGWWNHGVRRMVSLSHGRRFNDGGGERQRFETDLHQPHQHHLRGDQHVDMRLDVDNMTYEELLALGDQIGNVCTGLSHDMISNCLSKATPHDDTDGRKCVICLEEYLDGDEIGAIQRCGHDYHVPCITKWLSMKNVCPICKAPALAS